MERNRKHCKDCKHLITYCEGRCAHCNYTGNRYMSSDEHGYLTIPGCKYRTGKEKFPIYTDEVFKDGGQLIPINFSEIPFEPKRIFTVTNVHPISITKYSIKKEQKHFIEKPDTYEEMLIEFK